MLGFCYDFRVKEGDFPAGEKEKAVVRGDGKETALYFHFILYCKKTNCICI